MKIAVIGDYDQNRPSHLATSEALQQTGDYIPDDVSVKWIPTKSLETNNNLNLLLEYNGIWGAPGNPISSLGVINAIQVAREADIPYLGT